MREASVESRVTESNCLTSSLGLLTRPSSTVRLLSLPHARYCSAHSRVVRLLVPLYRISHPLLSSRCARQSVARCPPFDLLSSIQRDLLRQIDTVSDERMVDAEWYKLHRVKVVCTNRIAAADKSLLESEDYKSTKQQWDRELVIEVMEAAMRSRELTTNRAEVQS